MNTEFFWLKSKISTAIHKSDSINFKIWTTILNNINDDILDDDNNTVLHLVANSNNLQIMKPLLENKEISIDLNVQNKFGNTPLDLAVKNNCTEAVKELLVRGAKINYQNQDLFFWAVKNNDLTVIKTFIAHDKTIINKKNINGKTALDLAVNSNCTEVVKELLANNAKINYQNQDLFFWAAKNNDLTVIKEFITHNKANVDLKNSYGDSILHYAASNNSINVVNYLLEKRANPSITNRCSKTAAVEIEECLTRQIFAATPFSPELDSILTKYPQVLNQQNKFGDSPLMTQIRNKNVAMINCFLQKGANINYQNDDNDTAFSLSLTFLPNENDLHQQLFHEEIAKTILAGKKTKQEIATFLPENGGIKKYIFTITKAENDEYSFSKPVISDTEIITAKIFVVDFAMNTNNGIQKNHLFELQALDESGLDQTQQANHVLYLKKVFDQLSPDINYYYPEDHKRSTVFLNANHQSNKVIMFKQCSKNINNKALQLVVANNMCDLKNNGTVYPISKIYCSEQTNNEIIDDISKTVELGNIEKGVLKAFNQCTGNGNTFVNFTKDKLDARHFKDDKIVFQENISFLNEENGKYNSFRGLVLYFEDDNYQQYNKAIIFSKTCTSDCNSHNMESNDCKLFFYCDPKHSQKNLFYQGIVAEGYQLNKTTSDFLTGFIPVVKKMENYFQQSPNENWETKMLNEVIDFNNTADEALYARSISQQNTQSDLATLSANSAEIKTVSLKNTNELTFDKKEIEKLKDLTVMTNDDDKYSKNTMSNPSSLLEKRPLDQVVTTNDDELAKINEKEKELEANLITLQTLKAKTFESLEENKKQFDQKKIAAANEIEQELNNSKKNTKRKENKKASSLLI